MTSDTAIHTRALLVWLQISSWSARKYDRAVSTKVNRDNGASDDAGRYNKHLLPGDALSYKRLVALLSSLRAWHYNETLAWSDEGHRLLTTANFTNYADTLRQKIADVDRAVDSFVADYPVLRTQAALKLRGLYKPEDYPDVDDIRHRFGVNVSYSPVPIADDIRVNLAADQIALIEASINDTNQSAVQTAMNDCWQRLHSVVSHVATKLADPTAIFRDSLIENTSELCEVLKRLNVTGDPDLENMRAIVQQQIANMAPDTLRLNKHTRQQTANKAQAILDNMAAFYTAT